MKTPISTYRIQLHSEFTFKHLKQILPYLHRLGITTIYTSPFLEAVPGSTHCYDAINCQRINPELGTESELQQISHWLHEHQMTWLQDIVPNHMSVHRHNEWLMDVLEEGQSSEFYFFFDIVWDHPVYRGKLMMPLLDKPLEECIHQGELKLEVTNTGIWFALHTHRLPLCMEQYPFFVQILAQVVPQVALQADYEQLHQAIAQFVHPNSSQISEPLKHREEWMQLKQQLYDFVQSHPLLTQHFDDQLASLPQNLPQFTELVGKQNFCLVHWQEMDKVINYRRFFTINDLICLRMELKPVFEKSHQYISQLIDQDIIQHLRIDHIDGLLDPKVYLQRLHELAGEDRYVVVEKILEPGESLPSDWQTDGTTGYDFLSVVNRLLISDQSAETLSDIYKQMHLQAYDYEEAVYRKKLFMLIHHMGGELDNLTNLFLPLLPVTAQAEENRLSFRQVLAYWLVSFPVYRIYIDEDRLSETNAKLLADVFDKAAGRAKDLNDFFQVAQTVLAPLPTTVSPEKLHFLRRTQQFTGPLMAKGVEDTTFYVYNRLISRNEVGDTPDEGQNINRTLFHQQMQRRSLTTLNATATHDTKRGEDVRMRINVLSELTDEWKTHLQHWQSITEAYKDQPDANDVYFIYQTLIGTYPVHIAPEEENYYQRLQEYIQKVVREAKVHTNWASPDSGYEEKVSAFITALLGDKVFLKSLVPFVEKVAFYGAIYSWIQTLIRLTAPGIPDTYQGTELWDLSMVDPDNRRAVDYSQREKILADSQSLSTDELANLLKNPLHATLKLYILHRLLMLRRENPDLFLEGTYQAIPTTGQHRKQVMAYLREWKNQKVLVVFPLEIVSLSAPGQLPTGSQTWNETYLQLPETPISGQAYTNVFTNKSVNISSSVKIGDLLNTFPIGCWLLKTEIKDN